MQRQDCAEEVVSADYANPKEAGESCMQTTQGRIISAQAALVAGMALEHLEIHAAG